MTSHSIDDGPDHMDSGAAGGGPPAKGDADAAPKPLPAEPGVTTPPSRAPLDASSGDARLRSIADEIEHNTRDETRLVIERGLALLDLENRTSVAEMRAYAGAQLGLGPSMIDKYRALGHEFGRRIETVEYLPIKVLLDLVDRHTPQSVRDAVNLWWWNGKKPGADEIGSLITKARDDIRSGKRALKARREKAFGPRKRRKKIASDRLAYRTSRQVARVLRRDSPANLPDYREFFRTADLQQVRHLAFLLHIQEDDWVRWDDEKF